MQLFVNLYYTFLIFSAFTTGFMIYAVLTAKEVAEKYEKAENIIDESSEDN